MSYPPRPPLGRGMPLNMGMPPPMGGQGDPWGHAMRMGVQVPPPPIPTNIRPPQPYYPPGKAPDEVPVPRNYTIIQAKPSLNYIPPEHPNPTPLGPPVTVFVGNITERWPDAMIRQLLATCGQIINWKRVQGASGKLQGFGFCEFNGPDAGLRAVRLLHGLEVADKKLVAKVDAKTSTVLEEFKAERKKRKALSNGASTGEKKNGEDESDYMDLEMMETDERSRMRIDIIFREFKSELESYVTAGSESKEKDPSGKQAIQEKLHLLKLSSLEPPSSDADVTEDLAVEEGKREIITQEISKFRENMKQEKQREDERKKIGRERREKEKEREESRTKKDDKEAGNELSPKKRERDSSKSRGSASPVHRRRSRSSSRPKNELRKDRDRRGRSRSRDGGRNRGAFRDRDRERERDRGTRRRSRDRSGSKPDRDRSPRQNASHKPRYREREEEEEAAELKRIDRKARERDTSYEAALKIWEQREAKKAREYSKEAEKLKRLDEEIMREAKKMKQFFEDYDDEKHDNKYYKGKELQKRLADRANELEDDNRDRQREREELEEMKLRILTGSGTPIATGSSPATLFEKYKKPVIDLTNTSGAAPSQFQILSNMKSGTGGGSVQARLLSLAGQLPREKRKFAITPPTTNNLSVQTIAPKSTPSSIQLKPKLQIPPISIQSQLGYPGTSPVAAQNQLATGHSTQGHRPSNQPSTLQTTFDSVQFSSFVPLKSTSNSSTPNSSVNSPANVVPPEMKSPSIQSLVGTGFQISLNNSSSNNINQSVGSSAKVDDDSQHSYSPGGSPGNGHSPDNFAQEDDSSMHETSPDLPRRSKISVKDVFNQEEDDNDGLGSGRKRKLVPLDYGEEARKLKRDSKIQEDKKTHIKTLIDKIPTEKEALFAYDIDWEMVDTTLMEKRIRPWINKKIVEYIGEPEPTLVDFICSKVLAKSAPQSILDDVMQVLDEEAEVFIVKMWRLLVYEIEAKKIGIATTKT